MRGRRAGLADRVKATLEDCGHRVTAQPTTGPGLAGRAARESIERGADLVVSLGGDGTLNEVLSGMVHSHVPLAVIPGGTANVCACELDLGGTALKAAARLPDLVPRRVATGLVRFEADGAERHFLLMAGVGFDAHIVYGLNLGLKSKLGEFAYWTGAFGQLGRDLEQFDVSVDGESFTRSFALVSRVRNYAGYISIAENVSLLQDDFELVLFEGRSALRHYIKYLGAVLTGRASKTKGISFRRCRRVRFTAPASHPVYVQVDGEYAGRLPATVEIVPDSVTILAPSGYPRTG